MAVSSVASPAAARAARAGPAGDAARLLLAVRSRRLAATGPAGGSGGTAARRLKPGAGKLEADQEEEAGMLAWCDREDRFHRASLSLGRQSVAGPRACPVASVRPSAAAGWRLGDCPAEGGDGRVAAGEWDAAGLSWTSWDMIQNVRRADQADSGATDATRTERGFHAARIGETAGQRPFRWVTMGSL